MPVERPATVMVDLRADEYTFLVVATSSGFLYEHLADELGQAIDRGALRAGDRLPSVRRFAQERSVSVATVLEAYMRLENAGLI
ncbi:MAG TPA: winged helix-turn-helix domain-containing protein, partial [Kofleriaceae bacterium]